MIMGWRSPWFLGVTLILSFLPLCSAQATALRRGDYPMGGKYAGILLCSDCAGVWTEVTLGDPGVNAGQGSGTYVMTERFTGGIHEGATIRTRGSWSTVEQDKVDAYTGTLELRGAKQNGETPAPRSFFCDHGRSLRLLKMDARVVTASDLVTLQRVIPIPPFGPLTEAASHDTAVGRVGDTFEIDLPAPALNATLNAWTMDKPSSKSVALETVEGSGNGSAFVSVFLVKCVAPGKPRLNFRSVTRLSRTISFRFHVLP